MTSLQVFLPDDAVERIAALAAEAGRSPDAFLTEAILDYLEDFDDASLAEARLSDLRAGKGRTHTLEDVERDLGLAD